VEQIPADFQKPHKKFSSSQRQSYPTETLQVILEWGSSASKTNAAKNLLFFLLPELTNELTKQMLPRTQCVGHRALATVSTPRRSSDGVMQPSIT
jgi:hypothetical protein